MKHKKRIAVIGLKGLPAFGGAATVGEHLVCQLKDQYDFTVLSTASHASKSDTELNGVKQKVFTNVGKGGINTFWYYLKCLNHVIWNKYDMIHLHHAESGFITPLLKLKYRVIVTFHGVFENEDPKFSRIENNFFRFSERMNVKYADEIISVSNPDREYIFRKYKKEILYIPNGITLANYELSKDKYENYTLTFAAGRIYHIKGLHVLLNSLKKIERKLSLVVIGDLNQVPAYKAEIMELVNDLDVTFIGLLKNKKELFETISKSHLFIFPSLTEAMSMMLLEAASLKTPIIASDIAANVAIFSDEEVVFFESECVENLADKINLAIDNPELMNSKAAIAYDKLTNEFSWEIISKRYSEIFSNNYVG